MGTRMFLSFPIKKRRVKSGETTAKHAGARGSGVMVKLFAALLLPLALTLCGCMPDEQQMAATERADDAACRAQPNVPYDTCRALRIQYRTAAAQQDAANLDALGARLRNAGAALQAASAPPPVRQPMTCTYGPNTMTCL